MFRGAQGRPVELGRQSTTFHGVRVSDHGIVRDPGSSAFMFNLPNLIGGFLFSAVGFVAFCYGKKMARLWPLVIGVTLMVYPYFVGSTAMIYTAGSVLCVALYLLRER
jgi:hypothetical protein